MPLLSFHFRLIIIIVITIQISHFANRRFDGMVRTGRIQCGSSRGRMIKLLLYVLLLWKVVWRRVSHPSRSNVTIRTTHFQASSVTRPDSVFDDGSKFSIFEFVNCAGSCTRGTVGQVKSGHVMSGRKIVNCIMHW